LSAGLEGALSSAHRGTSAHFAITGASDGDAARARNAAELDATEQSVTHVTARAGETLLHEWLDRAELEGWA
jgi:hypothetical protein